MRNGLSYNDWRQMTYWQRQGLRLRIQHRDLLFGHKLTKAEGMSDTLGLILGRILNLD